MRTLWLDVIIHSLEEGLMSVQYSTVQGSGPLSLQLNLL